MEEVLILMVLVMLLIALGFAVGFFLACSKNSDLENRLSAAALNEHGAVAKLALVQASGFAERQGWAAERKAWDGERKAWDCEKEAMEAERKAWGEEKAALEAAVGAGAALKAEYERRVRSVARMVRLGGVSEGSGEGLFAKAESLKSWGSSEAAAIMGWSESSFDVEKVEKAKEEAKENVENVEKAKEEAKKEAGKAEELAGDSVVASANSHGSCYARGVGSEVREEVKKAGLAKELAELARVEAEKKAEAAELAKELAEKRAEAAEGRAEAAEGARVEAEKLALLAEKRVEERAAAINEWMILWLRKMEECRALASREGEYETTVQGLQEKLKELEDTAVAGAKDVVAGQ